MCVHSSSSSSWGKVTGILINAIKRLLVPPKKFLYQHQFSGSNNVTTQLGVVLEGPTKNHFLEDPKLHSLYFLMKIAGFRPSLTAQDFVDQGNVESVSLPSIIAFCSFSSNTMTEKKKYTRSLVFAAYFYEDLLSFARVLHKRDHD